MISHKYKCIFIHIQRTAGSSIENWICENDWWYIEPHTKHLTASQAKRIYADFWPDYYKFSFVREPVARVYSCLKYADHFGLKYDPASGIDFTVYHSIFGKNIILEHDYRYYYLSNLIRSKHQENVIYGNIIDEEIDFIGKFENISDDLKEVGKCVGITKPFDVHIERSNPIFIRDEPSEKGVQYIKSIYKNDIIRFGY